MGGAAVLILSVLAYHWNHSVWLQFALLFSAGPVNAGLPRQYSDRSDSLQRRPHIYIVPLAPASHSFAALH